MLFGTHLVAALLIGRVTTLAPLWLVVGAVTPDVIDKPVAMAGVTDLFHSLGHSTALLILVVPIALYSRAGLAAAIGWASHLLLDGVHVVINGRPGDVLFLFWPVVRPADPLKLPPGEFLLYYLWTPSFFLELCLWIALAGLLLRSWIRDDPEPSATGTDTR